MFFFRYKRINNNELVTILKAVVFVFWGRNLRMCRGASPGDSQASLLRWKPRRGLGHRVGALNYEPQDEPLTVIYHTRCWLSAALNVTTISWPMAFIPLQSWPNCLLETILSLSKLWFIIVIYDSLYVNHKPKDVSQRVVKCFFFWILYMTNTITKALVFMDRPALLSRSVWPWRAVLFLKV